jgi:hypothetical protein
MNINLTIILMKKLTILLALMLWTGILFLNAQTVNVTFRVDMQNEVISPNGVHIAGSFQGWSPSATPMNVPLIGFIYDLTIQATPGEQLLYKFINGNDWPAENVPAGCGLDDGFGGYNRYFNVPNEDVVINLVCFGSCVPCIVPDFDVTFHVDMSNETVAPNGVFIAGSFPASNWGNVAMSNAGNDIWTITLSLPEGNYYEYKFKNGTDGWESIFGTCTQNGNRHLTVPGSNTTLDPVCFGSCDPCTASTDINVTFRVDMSQQTVNPIGVHIAGGFQGWNPGGTPMTDMGNGIWQYATILQSGTYYEYKFVNGNDWPQAEVDIPWYCSNGGNRYLTVPETDTILPAVCFASCLVCNPPQVDVTFQVDMSLQTVSLSGVHIAGSFQGWNAAGTPMTNIGNDVYEVTLTLSAGEFHEYKFINGDSFDFAETVPGDCAGFGGNREFFVPAVNTTLDLVCFGECGPCQFTLYSFDLKVMLEGPFNGNNMNTTLFDQGLLPVDQPYSNEPWFYDGQEVLTATPIVGVVDWVYLVFRETDGDASTATPDKFLDHQAALVLSNGTIVRPDGVSPVLYTGNVTDNLYLIVYHRNHLAVMSATPLQLNGNEYSYDFTTSLSQAYLNGHKSLGGSKFGMIGGDSDVNGMIDEDDKDLNWTEEAGNAGYYSADLNLDSQVNNQDKDDLWVPNLGMESQVPEDIPILK